MASRIDIELTSRRDDGSFTWRAIGARQPKGVVDGTLVPSGSAVGAHLRADVEFGVDGIAVTQLLPARAEPGGATSGAQRIEVVGSGRATAGVSVSLAGGRRPAAGRGPRFDDDRAAPRPGNRAGADGGAGRAAGSSERGPSRPGADRGPGRPGGDHRPATPTADRHGARPGTGPGRPGAGRPERGERGELTGGPGRSSGTGRRSDGTDRARRRFQPSTTYRNAALAGLRPEELPVAEQLLRGGIPRVRQAIEEQDQRARAEGRDEVSAAPLLAMAESLLPQMNLAAWKDRAASARDAGRDTPLRELRSIVTAATTVTLDDEGREIATTLRHALQERVTALRDAWLSRMAKALDEGRIVDALGAASSPPEHGARLPAELAVRLAERAGASMTAELDPGAWSALLQAVLDSPVRRTVRPHALPEGADQALLATARRAAGSVPELARLLGLPIPPPPGPRRHVPSRD